MNSPHPHTFEIAIDREEFERIHAVLLRKLSLLILLALALIPLFYLWAYLDRAYVGSRPPSSIVVASLILAGTGCWAGTWLFHFVFGKRAAQRYVAKFHAFVEGPFLRIIDGDLDRKIHFRDIHDYNADLRPHRKRPGVATILMNQMQTKSPPIAAIRIPAVCDGLETRDLLAEIDAEREFSE